MKEIGSYAFSTKNYLMKDTATTLTLPEGVACSAYDMYGNPTEIINNTVKASLAPIYLVYEGNVIPEQFSCR